MQNKRVAVISSDGLSDGLMMMVAAHRLLSEDGNVTTFHDMLHELSDWFPRHSFQFKPTLEAAQQTLADFDLIIVQYDSNTYTRDLINILDQKNVSIFYPFYSKYTHNPLTSLDRVFNRHLPMVDNVSMAISSILNLYNHSKNNGLIPPGNLSHRKHKNRIAIVRSQAIYKKYIKISAEIEKLDFEPIFLEQKDLSSGAETIYESGYFIGPECDLCHLASNLHIPTLVVSGNKKPLSIRKPGWLRSSFITPPKWIPRAREKFIFTPRVLKGFKNLVAKDGIYL